MRGRECAKCRGEAEGEKVLALDARSSGRCKENHAYARRSPYVFVTWHEMRGFPSVIAVGWLPRHPWDHVQFLRG